jgi:hypothetical protein
MSILADGDTKLSPEDFPQGFRKIFAPLKGMDIF